MRRGGPGGRALRAGAPFPHPRRGRTSLPRPGAACGAGAGPEGGDGGGGGAGRPLAAAAAATTCRGAAAEELPGRPRRAGAAGGAAVLPAGRAALPLPSGRRGVGGERRAGPPTPAASAPRRAAAPSPPRLPEKRSSGSRSLGRMLRHGTLLRCEFPLPCLCFPGTPLLFQPSFPRAPQLVSCRQKPGCSCCPTFYPLAGGKGIFITVIALAAVTFNPSFPTALHR